MDKLTADQQKEVKKCDTERLRARLVRVGWDEEEVFSLDRPALLDAMAHVIL
jgi:hypothetical protein